MRNFKEFRNNWYMWKAECGMADEEHPEPTKTRMHEFIWHIYIKPWIAHYIICPVKGHDIECDDWGGPESGGMAGHCRRGCGWGYSHTLY